MARVTVKTMVIDALGTRTVDRDNALVPFGGRGLLVKQVPYGGPPLSYRLAVHIGPADASGEIPVTLVADVWNGSVEEAPEAADRSQRQESGRVGEGSSRLMELAYHEETDRRILVSVSAVPDDGDEAVDIASLLGPQAAVPVDFYIVVSRQQGGVPEPPESYILTAIVGHPVTYSSEVRAASGSGATTGVSVTLTAEMARHGLVTVRVRLTGADYIDVERQRTLPINHSSVHTVKSGLPLSVDLRLPPEKTDDPAIVPVVYTVTVTPFVNKL